MGTGSMGTGSMATGSMGTGSMGTGSMGTGSMSTGSMGTGSMGTGSMATGSMGTGSMGTGRMGTGSMGTGSMGPTHSGDVEQPGSGSGSGPDVVGEIRYACTHTMLTLCSCLFVASNATAVWFYVLDLFYTWWLPMFPDSRYLTSKLFSPLYCPVAPRNRH